MSLPGGNGLGGNGLGAGGGHKVPRLRLSMMAVVATALFASLFARLYDLQVVGSSDYQVQAEANRVRKVLVDNRVAVVVAIDREVFGDLDRAGQTALLQRLTGELAAAGHAITPEEV